MKKNKDYLEEKFPTQTKRINSLFNNNRGWEATKSSEFSLRIVLDSGISSHVVNSVAFLTNVKQIQPMIVEHAKGNRVEASHQGS